jgi:hypothetical protein
MSITTKKVQKKLKSDHSVFRKKESSQKSTAILNNPVGNILQLHQTIGNQAVQQLFESGTIQKKPITSTVQRQVEPEEEEETIQTKSTEVIQNKENNTGLPDNLKTDIENLSGHSMDDVKVHYNSSKPAQLNAHAFAQGSDIHLGSGQEKHLPHEAWHVVQQKQGRVQPTKQLKGKVNINDDEGLEREADLMGDRALQGKKNEKIEIKKINKLGINSIVQLDKTTKINRKYFNPFLPTYKISIIGHASPRWRHPRVSTRIKKNMILSKSRAQSVEDSLRAIFFMRKGIKLNSIKTDWKGSSQTLKEANGNEDANDQSFRSVNINVILQDVTSGSYYFEILPTNTRDWAIKVDVIEAAAGAAGTIGQGELKNLKTGQKVKGRWFAGGGGGGVDLPIPSVAPGKWTNLKTNAPFTFSNFNNSPIRLTALAAGIFFGYGIARFRFVYLMDNSITLNGVVFNQYGIGGSLTSGSWKFTEKIPNPPTTKKRTSDQVIKTSFSHSVLFNTSSSLISSSENKLLSKFVRRLLSGVK